ncbi:mannose-6-phosphate isomerase, class I, partial [Thermodesulfobacteriota bacterium]
MNKIAILENRILEYAWGSRSYISSLTGKKTPSAKPQAEMWMGAHRKAPSIVNTENKKIPLDELIREHPVEILNRSAADKFSKELPFLFKVLAASKPLSIQAHPDKKQAAEGFNREEINKIPVDAPERNYRDKNHKPELICAISNMWLLKGFRHPLQILEFFSPFEKILNKPGNDFIKKLAASGNLKDFFKDLLYVDERTKNRLLDEMLNISEKLINSDPAYKWV